MKRALIVVTGTIAGVAAVLGLNPEGSSSAQSLATASAKHSTTTGAAASSGSGSTKSSGAQTVAGTSVDVGYGIVQVQATLRAGRLVDIQALSLPQSDGHSARISNQAWPDLVTQAIAAQSSQIAGVSGASYTSYGFTESLKAALLSAGHAA
jgi:uncharacterized protein with FMN-binding domain